MTKMAKINTKFMTKTAEKPYPLGKGVPIRLHVSIIFYMLGKVPPCLN